MAVGIGLWIWFHQIKSMWGLEWLWANAEPCTKSATLQKPRNSCDLLERLPMTLTVERGSTTCGWSSVTFNLWLISFPRAERTWSKWLTCFCFHTLRVCLGFGGELASHACPICDLQICWQRWQLDGGKTFQPWPDTHTCTASMFHWHYNIHPYLVCIYMSVFTQLAESLPGGSRQLSGGLTHKPLSSHSIVSGKGMKAPVYPSIYGHPSYGRPYHFDQK